MELSLTIIIIAATALISISAFSSNRLINDLIFYPAQMKGGRQYYRFLTHGFIHGDWMHLIFNMFTLYFFGRLIEMAFTSWTGNKFIYLIFYLTAIIVSEIPSYFKHRDNYYYRSLGASGGVNAVLFSFVLIAPWQTLLVWFIPLPAIAFAVLYVIYSIYMEKRGGDNINHSAHLWGAAYGIGFTLVIKPELASRFIDQLLKPSF